MLERSYPSYPDLRGRTAVVTGGTKGIGLAVAEAFVQNGVHTFIVGRSDKAAFAAALELLQGLAGEALVGGYLGDLSDPGAVREIFGDVLGAVSQVDILVNNAGGFTSRRPMLELGDDEWAEMLQSNLSSAFYCAREALPGMLAAGWGRIISMSSQAATNPPWPTGAHYAAAKAGILGLTRHMAREFGARGVCANILIPGTTATERLRGTMNPAALARAVETIPAGRYAEPWEPASAVLFLASAGAGYINGATIECNGGRSTR